jgi:hypothetical protein
MNTGIQFPLITHKGSPSLRVWVYKLIQILEDRFPQTTLDIRFLTISSSSAALNKPIPSAVRTIAGLSGKEISFDFFFSGGVPSGWDFVDEALGYQVVVPSDR